MKNNKRILALLLTFVMLFSALPVSVAAEKGTDEEAIFQEQQMLEAQLRAERMEDQMQQGGFSDYMENERLTSMMPLDETFASLNMTGYLPDELEYTPVATITNNLKLRNTSQPVQVEGQIVAYAKWGYYDEDGNYVGENDNYTVIGPSDTIDLSNNGSYKWANSFTLELIAGSADQLNTGNKRYIVEVTTTPITELFTFSVANTNREPIAVYDSYFYTDRGSESKNLMEFGVDGYAWESGEAYLNMQLDNAFGGLTATIYKGYYTKWEGIPESAEDVTDQIYGQQNFPAEGGYRGNFGYQSGYQNMFEVTAVLKRGNSIVMIRPMILYMYGRKYDVYTYGLYARNNNQTDYVSKSSKYTYTNNYQHQTITLKDGYAANGTYYLTLRLDNPAEPDSDTGLAYVSKAVVGHYETAAAIPGNATDIKQQLFTSAYTGGGYTADFSGGVDFTVIDTKGDIHWYYLKTVDGGAAQPAAPTPLSADTYFRMQGANKGTTGSYRSWVMPYDADSYYYNGYQTVFLLNNDGTYVTDHDIKPVFYTSNSVNMFASDSHEAANKQISGETSRTFTSGNVITYSAAAENNTNLKNYWVTFVTQSQDGPKLFVNAANDESRYVAVEGSNEKVLQREVFLNEDYGNHHDVFFANVGNTAMNNVYVTLKDAENIALDEYWTIGETKTLQPFTTTNKTTSYGEIPNVAKIRLVPETDSEGNVKSGEIKGTLIIGYGTEQNPGESVEIHLTGVAGAPKITTASPLPNGVKYVPYSRVIQTNNMYSDNTSFSVTAGALPNGMVLKANGELYGRPKETGTFTFTVTATASGDIYGGAVSDSKEFTLTILENTDANVNATNEDSQGYALLKAINDVTTGPESEENPGDQLFVSSGTFSQFVAFYLDGDELTEGTDYTKEEGSTKITVRTQTLQNAGTGTHTISAEFRTGSGNGSEMYRTSQNVTVTQYTPSYDYSYYYTPTYVVTYTHNEGGELLPSALVASAWTSMVVIAKPADGYRLKEITATGGVVLTDTGDNRYTFTMPYGNITVNAVFEKITYSITVEEATGGNVSSSATTAVPGDSITVTVTPDRGFALKEITGTGVALKKQSETEYSFVMPEQDVTIKAVFDEMEADPETGLPFVDVKSTDWFVDAVKYVYEHGLMNGTGDDMFEPNLAANRGMIITVLYRMEGSPEITGENPFADIDGSEYYADAVIWGAENGIVLGYDGEFHADENATREQLAAIMFRYAKYKGMNVTAEADLSKYEDADEISDYAMEAITWANANGIMIGTSSTTIAPKDDATRAEFATILQRYCELLVENGVL